MYLNSRAGNFSAKAPTDGLRGSCTGVRLEYLQAPAFPAWALEGHPSNPAVVIAYRASLGWPRHLAAVLGILFLCQAARQIWVFFVFSLLRP